MPVTNMVTCKNKRGEEVFVSLQVNAQKQPPSSENLTLESIYSTVLLFFASCEFGRDVQGVLPYTFLPLANVHRQNGLVPSSSFL